MSEPEPDDSNFNQIDDECHEAITEYIESKGKEVYVIYSAYGREPGNRKMYVNNLDERPCGEGKVKIVYGSGGRGYNVELLRPTHLELAYHANQAIMETQDYHHVFYEGVRKVTDGLYELCMGS